MKVSAGYFPGNIFAPADVRGVVHHLFCNFDFKTC